MSKKELYDFLPTIWDQITVLRGGYFTTQTGYKVANSPFPGVPENTVVILDLNVGAILSISKPGEFLSANLQTAGGNLVIDHSKSIGDETLVSRSETFLEMVTEQTRELSPDYELNMLVSSPNTTEAEGKSPSELYDAWIVVARNKMVDNPSDDSGKAQETNLHFSKVEEFLNQLIGLKELKKTLLRFLAILKFAEKTKGEIPLERPNLHMVFKGNPGTGKTTVANKLAELYGDLGFLGAEEAGGKPVKLTIVNGANLLTEEAAVKVKKLVDDACGGILLIDEAYAITESHRGIGDEIIAMLLTEMEMKRDELAIILAGYTDKMSKFLSFNPGLRSRVGATINFEDYTPDELLTMLIRKFNKAGLTVTPEARNKMIDVFKVAVRYNDFGNGRFVADFFEDILAEHSVQTENSYSLEELRTIKERDVTNDIIQNIVKGATFKG